MIESKSLKHTPYCTNVIPNPELQHRNYVKGKNDSVFDPVAFDLISAKVTHGWLHIHCKDLSQWGKVRVFSQNMFNAAARKLVCPNMKSIYRKSERDFKHSPLT